MQKRPFVPIVLSFIAGTLLANHFQAHTDTLIVCVCLLFFISIVLHRLPKTGSAAFLCLILFMGALHSAIWQRQLFDPTLSLLPTYQKVTVSGTVADTPQTRGKTTQLKIQLSGIRKGSSFLPARGYVLARTRVDQFAFSQNDNVLVSGHLVWPLPHRNPGDFNYRRYTLRQRIQALIQVRKDGFIVKTERGKTDTWLKAGLDTARRFIQRWIQTLEGKNTRAIIKALILGVRADIEPDIMDNFSRSGIIHVLAVSGLHVGFIGLIIFSIARAMRLNRRHAIWAVLCVIWLYALITGMKPPVVRASIMGSMLLISQLLDRKLDGANMLAVAALAILVWAPLDLYAMGFQLSFCAVAGIMYMFNKVEYFFKTHLFFERLYKNPAFQYIGSILVLSLVAQLASLPLTAYYFGRISIAGLVSNLVIVPTVFITLALTFVALVSWIILPISESFFSTALNWIIDFIVQVSTTMAGFSFSTIENWFPTTSWILGYFLILILIFSWNSKQIRWLAIMMILGLGTYINFKEEADNTSTEVKVTFLDVGQGDCAFIEFADGRNVLVDCGPWSPGYDAGERIITPFLRRKNITSIDMIFLSHPHLDHYGGAETLVNNFSVKKVVLADTTYKNNRFKQVVSVLKAKDLSIHIAKRGDIIDDFEPARFWIMGPSPANAKLQREQNNASLIMQLRFGKTAFLFTGDAELAAETTVLPYRTMLKSAVLKVGHHGSRTSSSTAFLESIQPEYAILSLGSFNKFNHPANVTTSTLSNMGADTIRTDLAGAAVFTSNGRAIKWLKSR